MVKVGEKYRHYKSAGWDDHTYRIESIGFFQWKDAYEDEQVVVYKPLYPIDDLPAEIDVIVRPLKEWFTEVEYNGQRVPRFTLIEDK